MDFVVWLILCIGIYIVPAGIGAFINLDWTLRFYDMGNRVSCDICRLYCCCNHNSCNGWE